MHTLYDAVVTAPRFTSTVMRKFICVEDYEEEAKSKLGEKWDYYASGSCLGETARENVEAYRK